MKPSGPSSVASLRKYMLTAALDTESANDGSQQVSHGGREGSCNGQVVAHGRVGARVRDASREVVVNIFLPSPLRRRGRAASVRRIAPVTLTLSERSMSAAVAAVASVAMPTPALLTRLTIQS